MASLFSIIQIVSTIGSMNYRNNFIVRYLYDRYQNFSYRGNTEAEMLIDLENQIVSYETNFEYEELSKTVIITDIKRDINLKKN